MASRSQRKSKTKKSEGKRLRATAVAINKDEHVLLVHDKGKRSYSLQGGGINSNEPTISAATRDVFEDNWNGPSSTDIQKKLTSGNPSIEVGVGQYGYELYVSPTNLEPGEEEMIAEALQAEFS